METLARGEVTVLGRLDPLGKKDFYRLLFFLRLAWWAVAVGVRSNRSD